MCRIFTRKSFAVCLELISEGVRFLSRSVAVSAPHLYNAVCQMTLKTGTALMPMSVIIVLSPGTR